MIGMETRTAVVKDGKSLGDRGTEVARQEILDIAECGWIRLSQTEISGSGVFSTIAGAVPSLEDAQKLVFSISDVGNKGITRFGDVVTPARASESQSGVYKSLIYTNMILIGDNRGKVCRFHGRYSRRTLRAPPNGKSMRLGELLVSPNSDLVKQIGSFILHRITHDGSTYVHFGGKHERLEGFMYTKMIPSQNEFVAMGTLNSIIRVRVVFSTMYSEPLILNDDIREFLKNIESPITITIAGIPLKFRTYEWANEKGIPEMSIIVNPLAISRVSFVFDITNKLIGLGYAF